MTCQTCGGSGILVEVQKTYLLFFLPARETRREVWCPDCGGDGGEEEREEG